MKNKLDPLKTGDRVMATRRNGSKRKGTVCAVYGKPEDPVGVMVEMDNGVDFVFDVNQCVRLVKSKNKRKINELKVGDTVTVFNANIRVYEQVYGGLNVGKTSEWGPYVATVKDINHEWGCGQLSMLVTNSSGIDYAVYRQQCRRLIRESGVNFNELPT